MKKIFMYFLFGILIILLIFISFFFIGNPLQAKEIKWGVNFSQKHAQLLGLNWQETYLSLFDDLKIKHLKLITHWDLIEPEQGKYDFKDLDWQIDRAEEKGVKIILVIGMKTGRWPECHIPDWAGNLKKEEQQERILKLIENIILRYKNSEAIWAWQVENEPLFSFGECPWQDEKFLKKEVEKTRLFDKKRLVIITDSGEQSLWIKAAKTGDMVGTTLYRKLWSKEISTYITYPLKPIFYWRKAQIIKKIFNKKVFVAELQAEPWGPRLLYNLPLEEQKKTMDLEKFIESVEFAKKTGFNEFYLWGAEWWYWLKEKQNDPSIWNEAKILF